MYKIIVEYVHAKVTITAEIVRATRELCIAQAESTVQVSTAYSYNIISEGAVNE